jgi:flagellar hook-basal body complex protein FliE
MIPMVPQSVSLFGAPLAVASPLDSMVNPVTNSAASLTAGAGTLGVPGAPPALFADLITEAVGQVQHLEQQAQASIEGLFSGKGVDVHEAMIATQKAGMGFELMLSVRNKALAAYQQVMGMQF